MRKYCEYFHAGEFREALAPGASNLVLDNFMKRLKPNIIPYLTHLGADPEEAETAFLTGITAVWRRGESSGYESGFKFYPYLIKSCKYSLYNQWRNKNSRQKLITAIGSEVLQVDEPSILDIIIKCETYELLDKLGEPCTTLLKLSTQGYSYEEIAQIMKTATGEMRYHNANSARQQNFKCMARLKKLFERS